jgi:hypothetical protein
VAGLLADRDFVADVCAASAATAWDVEVSGGPEGAFTVTTVRTLPTDELPDTFRRLLGGSLQVRQVDSWQAPAGDGSRSGSTELAVVGKPVRATATMALRPGGSGCEQVVTGELSAKVPLVGGRVERAAEPALVAALREQEQLAAARLSTG